MEKGYTIDIILIFLILIFLITLVYSISIYENDSVLCLSSPIQYLENKNNLTCSCTERNEFDYKYFELNVSG